MAKAGSFRPGKSGPSAPRVAQGRNGPSGRDPKNGTPHPNVGTNRSGGVGDNANTAQAKPGC